MTSFEPGARHPDIELAQLALSRAGYNLDMLDGIYGQFTADALSAFRRDRRLADTPEITDADWQAFTPFLTGYSRRTVREGDTLYSLARLFKTSVDAILTANPSVAAENLPVGTQLIIPLNFDVVPTNISFTSTVLDFAVQGLTARYPLIGRSSIGQSVSGLDIPVLTFGRGENHVGYNAAHHANEWITSPILLKFFETYAKAQSTSGRIATMDANRLFNESTLHLIPMVNPDGVDIATGALQSGTFYDYAVMLSQNYPDIPFPEGWKANIRGVDLNLQYPASWDLAREIKFAQGFTMPGPRDYVGSSALSEPESLAMYNYTIENDFQLTLSYHTQGQVIYWKYKDYLPENSWEIARVFSALSGYTVEETPPASGNAGYKDWFIQLFNRPGYTIEAGYGVSPLPITQFDEIYADNEALLAIGLIITSI